MAVHVDLCPRGLWCRDQRCNFPARLAIQVSGESPREYCLDCGPSRLGVHKTRDEQITWTDSARFWVESQGGRVIS